METAFTTKPDEKKSVGPASADAFAEAARQRTELGAPAGLPLFLPGPLQAKLAVGAADDPLEMEADRVADAVMSNSFVPTNLQLDNQVLQRKCACGGSSSGECEECQKKRQETTSVAPMVQRRASDDSAGAGDASPIVHDALSSPGQPLDASLRPLMENRFGRDFGDVRVHTNTVAAKSAQAINALAYTSGKDVVFAPGQYDPETLRGKGLLAHELVHVVQQKTESEFNARYVIRRQPDTAAP